jgi:hypothetical protein
MTFQIALATLLVNENARRQLQIEPATLQRQFGLTDLELAALEKLDTQMLDFVARSIHFKRLEFLTRALPATLAALEEVGKRFVVQDFLNETNLLVVNGYTPRTLHEASLFSDFLNTRKSDPLFRVIANIALFELTQLQLLESPEMPTAPPRTAGSEFADQSWMNVIREESGESIVLSKHVKLESFEYDVVTLSTAVMSRQAILSEQIEEKITHLLFIKSNDTSALLVCRIGHRSATLLKRCKNSVSIREAISITPFDEDSSALEVLQHMYYQGFLMVTGVIQSPSAGSET